MAGLLSPAKTILLAVQLASQGNVTEFRSLISQYRQSVSTENVLRVLLTYLPETSPSSSYMLIVQDLCSGNSAEIPNAPFDVSGVEQLTEGQAARKVKKLHLLSLAWPNAPLDAPEDQIVLFLIHRSLRIDENAGLITEVPGLLGPFLHISSYLRTFLISNILPLLRFSYEYYPETTTTIPSIASFERLDNESGVNLLLSHTNAESDQNRTIGRDLRGLVGPWIYGDSIFKRQRLERNSSSDTQRIVPINKAHIAQGRCICWEPVFQWITGKAITSWKTAAQAFDQWDGPGDIDFGEYGDMAEWLDEFDQQYLERRYARSALASTYLIPDMSIEALVGGHQILSRIIVLMDLERIPTLEASGALLDPIGELEIRYSKADAVYVRKSLLSEKNTLTKADKPSLRFLHAILISAYLMTKEDVPMTVARAAELALNQDESDQTLEFKNLMLSDDGRSRNTGDDKFWVKLRNEVLWLRNWGSEELLQGTDAGCGRGIFGRLSRDMVEVTFLKNLLASNRLTLAQSIYETASDPPLRKQVLHDTVLSAAMEAYDNATNPNKSRGGIRKCQDILNAFPNILRDSKKTNQVRYLIDLTNEVGEYRIVFKKGEPFTPVLLRVNDDPISILGKILDQNPKSYTKINDFVHMGKNMVKAGLTSNTKGGTHTQYLETQDESIAEKRVTCMCIDAALNDDDFETAYSYVMSRLEVLAKSAQARKLDCNFKSAGLAAERLPLLLDDWSWKAALQAGKYRRNQLTVKPTHLGNANSNLEIRHLQQRMDCLSLALRCAPSSALQEILNTYRRCEEELDTKMKQEEENEAAWDAQGDDQVMPGGFQVSKRNEPRRNSSLPAEEAPISLFELSRAGMARAQNGLSALSKLQVNKYNEDLGDGPTETSAQRTRKRDQLKNAAVGTLASGVGWLIGAPVSAPVSLTGRGEEGRPVNMSMTMKSV